MKHMDKKEEIMEASFKLFSESGYSLSMSEIAKEVNLKTPSLYSHFQSKDDIIYICIEREIKRYYEFLDQILNKEYESTEEYLKDLYFSIIDYYSKDRTLRFWKKLGTINNEGLRYKYRTIMNNSENKNRPRYKKIFEIGVEKGEIKKENIEGKRYLFLSMVQGVLDTITLNNREKLDDMEFIEKTWQAYWDGLRKDRV